MEKKRLLIFTDCYTYGGSERLMIFLVNNKFVNEKFEIILAYRKYEEYEQKLFSDLDRLKIKASLCPVHLFSNATLFNRINSKQKSSIIKNLIKLPYFIFACTGIYFFYNTIVFFSLLKRLRPDVIHINNGGYPGAASCNQLTLVAHTFAFKNIIYQVNNIALSTKYFFSGWYDKVIAKKIKYFITASRRAKEGLVEKRGFEPSKIIQIPNTVPLEKPSKSKSVILEELNWPDCSFLLVQIAFLTERKGQIYLLNAIQKIKEQYSSEIANSIKLVLIGDGENEHVLKQYVTENNLTNNIFFAGYQANSIDYINASDVFLLPSIANEDMPLSLLTAMNCARPIIATDLAGIAEAINSEENGLLIALDKELLAERLKEAIMRLYRSEKLRATIGRNAQDTFYKHYSQKAYGEKLSDLYKLAIDKKSF